MQWTIIRRRVNAPVSGTANVSDARAKPIAEYPEESKDHVRVRAGVRHDLDGMKFCWLLENDSQQHKTVSQTICQDCQRQPPTTALARQGGYAHTLKGYFYINLGGTPCRENSRTSRYRHQRITRFHRKRRF